jgi:hypothetical protein
MQKLFGRNIREEVNNMRINKKDVDILCAIARELNDYGEREVDIQWCWEKLNDVIQNIDG